MFDLGFLGAEKDFAEQKHPYISKSRKTANLLYSKTVYNRNHSRKRIVIEHVICRLKKYRIMNDVFRNKIRRYDKISDIVSGRVNYRILNSQN